MPVLVLALSRRSLSDGVVPQYADLSRNTTIPNDLFDEMDAGCPVITWDDASAARVVRAAGTGLVSLSEDSADLARSIRTLPHPALLAEFEAAGRRAVPPRHGRLIRLRFFV